MGSGRFGIAALLVLAGVAGCGPPRPGEPRHVVLISMDTTRADHFGFMGADWIRTPHLDRLAERSIVFTDCMNAAPSTLASHAALFTGRYPHNHGTPRNGFPVNDGNETLGEILGREGFTTAGFIAAFALESRFNLNQGFDHWDQTFTRPAAQMEGAQDQRPAGDVTDAVVRYLDASEIPERLFLFVHYFDPHRPYAPPAAFEKGGRVGEAPSLSAPWLSAPGRWARKQARLYAGEIAYMDAEIGRLLDDLSRRGILDEALVLVTSDHGEAFWEHAEEFDHGAGVYQTTMQAVCLLRLQEDRMGGTRFPGLVSSIDLLPTVMEELGIPPPDGIDGEAIPLARAAGPERARFGQATKPHGSVEAGEAWANMKKARCVRRGPFKLIQTPYLGTEELYNLLADPAEQENLLEIASPGAAETARKLREELEAWAASASPLPSVFAPSETEETIRRLKSLGYIDDDE